MSDFLLFASSHGLIINHLTHGKITRCPTEGHRSKRNGAFFFDGAWGWIQNWAEHEAPILWKSDKVIDNQEFQRKIKDSQTKYAVERKKLQADAASKAKWILGQCELNLSAYLARKGFPEISTNLWTKGGDYPVLVIPMRIDKEIIGCQLIDNDGNKKFLRGQVTNDACFTIGQGRQVFMVEGYASGLSLQVILQTLRISYQIKVTFSAGNLARFARRFDGFVIADNDASGVGQRVATESGRRWWMSPKTGQDINDYHLSDGVFKVSQEIRKLIYSR